MTFKMWNIFNISPLKTDTKLDVEFDVFLTVHHSIDLFQLPT
jgi:hypothetical protein